MTELIDSKQADSALEAQAVLVDELDKAIDRLNATTLKDVYAQLGIKAPPAPQKASWSSVEYSVDRDLTVCAMTVDGAKRVLAEGQRQIGVPGTYIVDGRIEVEQNTRTKPFQARGRLGRPGTNEDTYRKEPIAFKSVNEITAIGENADYEPIGFDKAPANVRKEVLRQHRAIRRALFDGDVLANALPGLAKHGFAFFEVGWKGLREDDGPSPKVSYIDFREQASVERWVFDERQSRHVATEFKTTAFAGKDSTHYLIPNGSTIRTARTMLVNVYATGNNLEGVSPIRVITGLRKMKEVILNAYAIGFQKYAVPIATIATELTDAAAAAIARMGQAGHKAEQQKLVTRLEALRGRMGAVLPVPTGSRLEFQNPTNDMVDPTAMLQYLDGMMALVFANEGTLLGMQSFGSYAMASQSDAKFFRSAVVYSSRIARSLTRLLHIGLELNGIDLDDLDELPRYGFRFNGTQDASRWLADLCMVMNAMAATGPWPDEVRQAAAGKLGLSLQAFDELARRQEEQGSITMDEAVRLRGEEEE